MIDFDTLYTRYYHAVYTRLYSLTNGHTQQAEDLTQDTFVKALAAFPTLHDSNLNAWLLTIATRLYFDAWRKYKVQQSHGFDHSLDAICSNGMDVEDSRLSDLAERGAMGDLRRRALRRLTVFQRNELRRAGRGECRGRKNMALSRARRAYREAMEEVSA